MKKLGLILSIVFVAVGSQAKECYQTTGEASLISGLTDDFQLSLLIGDSGKASDEFTLISGSKRASLFVWCRDNESGTCVIDAADQSFDVKKSKDANGVDQLEFTFPGKPQYRVSYGESEIRFQPTSESSSRKFTLKKVDVSKCPKTPRPPLRNFRDPEKSGSGRN